MTDSNGRLIEKIFLAITDHHGVKSWKEKPTQEMLSNSLQCIMSIMASMIENISGKEYEAATQMLDDLTTTMRIILRDRLKDKPVTKKEEAN